MDKIQKFLQKLSKRQRANILRVLEDIVAGSFEHLDIKKLKGHRFIYRVRIGDMRIIFQRTGKEIRVLEIGKRGEQTYKDF